MILSHAISPNSDTALVKKTFQKAYEQRCPSEGLIFHSDQGSVYTAYTFRCATACRSWICRWSCSQVRRSVIWSGLSAPIVFAEDGTLLMGRHRLWGVFEAGIPVEFLVAYEAA